MSLFCLKLTKQRQYEMRETFAENAKEKVFLGIKFK